MLTIFFARVDQDNSTKFISHPKLNTSFFFQDVHFSCDAMCFDTWYITSNLIWVLTNPYCMSSLQQHGCRIHCGPVTSWVAVLVELPLCSTCLIKQECIPVGRVPPAHWPHVVEGARGRGRARWGACMAGGVCVARTSPLPCTPPSPVDRQTPVKT